MTTTTAKGPEQGSGKNRLPAVFLGHGTPMLALQEADSDEGDKYVRALRAFANALPEKPQAVVVLSAHGVSPDPIVEINASERPYILYDFRGFPGPLYQIEYPVKGSPQLAVRVAALLADAGFETNLKGHSGLDHGVWIPLRAAFPDADVPIIQVSMPHPSQPEKILKLGKALAPLRDEGVLIVGSGGIVHNLDKLVWHQKNGPAAPWAKEFEAWVLERLEARDVMGLCDFEDTGPQAKLAHPTTEHFYPIFFTLGASLPGDGLLTIFEGIEYESLSMSCFALMPAASLR
jgi:4,5-DOPA dioxygenase extradiol